MHQNALLTLHAAFLAAYLLPPVATRAAASAAQPTTRPTESGLVFLFHGDPQFLAGLQKHGLLRDYGLRLNNTGLDARPFGTKWSGSTQLAEARASGRPYYIDRITGGMPYQSLEGLEALADILKGDSSFLGFQVHEWGNSPIADYKRIRELFVDKGVAFNREHFAQYAGRIEPPYFGGGDFDTYGVLFRPLASLPAVDEYLRDYLATLIQRTRGQVVAVNGYIQGYHTAFELGTRHVMAEIGNQVPLTALQIACVRGAARQAGRPWGAYYEPWGGRPFGCPCATSFSPWFAHSGLKREEWTNLEPNIKGTYGRSRALHRRLLWYAWLSGATWWAEEWGAENYFANWEDYPLTDYGRVTKEFLEATARLGRPEPLVPAAIVLPPGIRNIDLKFVGGKRSKLHDLVEPDAFHLRLRDFAVRVLGASLDAPDRESNNLTASPWIGCLDVLSANAARTVLDGYGLLLYFDAEQAANTPVDATRVHLYTGEPRNAEQAIAALRRLVPFHVQGQVGCTMARLGDRHIIGLSNNLGVENVNGVMKIDSSQSQRATLGGPLRKPRFLLGGEHCVGKAEDRLELTLPPGQLAIVVCD